MGLIMKKDDSEDNEYIDGIEVVGRGEGPNGDDEVEHVEIHEGLTAEDISGKTAAAEAERELEADPELLDADAEEGGAADAGEADGEPEPEGVEDHSRRSMGQPFSMSCLISAAIQIEDGEHESTAT